ncbi:MAG: universal stress protein [Symploca sp. SIO2B6]|nr:universal stress protein [Symploca sp. SIO2B6]
MFKKILVALDYSSNSTLIFAKALDLAKSMGANLMLLHVFADTDEGSPKALLYPSLSYYPVMDNPFWDDYHRRWEEFESETLSWLQRLVEQAINEGVSTELTHTRGWPSHQIKALSETWEADLIVMGSRGRRGFTELFLGSVSNDVMHRAGCSVLVVHDTSTEEGKVNAQDNSLYQTPSGMNT